MHVPEMITYHLIAHPRYACWWRATVGDVTAEGPTITAVRAALEVQCTPARREEGR